MPDDHEVLRNLSAEQVLERARAGELELEYWAKVLDDLHELHEGVHAIADQLTSSTGAVLGLLPLVAQTGTGSIELILDANGAGLKRLRLMQETLLRTLDLVLGRQQVHSDTAAALAEAIGIELDRDDAQD